MTLYENYVLLTFRALALRQSKRRESEPSDPTTAIHAYSYTTIIDHLERETFCLGGLVVIVFLLPIQRLNADGETGN